MKKILLMGGLSSGGAEHQMVIVARHLKRQGHDVTYLCGGKSDFFKKKLDEVGIPIIWLHENRLMSLMRLSTPYISFQVRNILKRGKYDTVISFLGFWNYENCLFANKRGTKHRAITGIRNNRDEVFLSWRDKYYTRFEQYAYRKVSNSNAAKVRFATCFPRVADKLITIYNIVELPPITTHYELRKNGRVHIIVPASYRAVKNPMALLKAVSKMKYKDRSRIQIDWYGSIQGGRACYDEMQAYINKYKLTDSVKLYDATTDIANRINEADVVGLFSTSEGLPNSVCEGMMLGKPVVMTQVSDYNELAGGGNGFLCDANDIQSISDALSSLAQLSDEELLKMGIISKEKAIRLFSEDGLLKKWEDII